MRLPIIVGCVQVSESATVYFLTCSKPVAPVRNTTSSPSSSRLNTTSPARTTAAFPACRGSDSHNVFPVLASTLKYCPLLRVDSPKSASPTRTLLLRRYGMSAFSQAFSDVPAKDLADVYAYLRSLRSTAPAAASIPLLSDILQQIAARR